MYIIVMRDTAFWTVGPFADEDQVLAWGESEDDPRWQSIRLREDETHNLKPPTWHPGYTP